MDSTSEMDSRTDPGADPTEFKRFLGHWPHNRTFEAHVVDTEDEVPKRQHQPRELDNDIHRLWQFRNWRNVRYSKHFVKSDEGQWTPDIGDHPDADISPELYEAMKPALRLATLLLLRARPFLAMILSCHIVPFEPDLTRNLFDQDWAIEKCHLDTLDVQLDALADEYRLPWMTVQHPADPHGETIQAVTFPAENTDSFAGPVTQSFPIITVVAIEPMSQFLDPNWNQRPSIEKMIVSLLFATMLVHELAHVTYMRRDWLAKRPGAFRRNEIFSSAEPIVLPGDHSGEPWLPGWNNELGQMVMKWTIGCELLPPWRQWWTEDDILGGSSQPEFRSDFGGRHLPTAVGLDDRDTYLCTDAHQLPTISRETVESLFDMNTWWKERLALYFVRQPKNRPFLDPLPDVNELAYINSGIGRW